MNCTNMNPHPKRSNNCPKQCQIKTVWDNNLKTTVMMIYHDDLMMCMCGNMANETLSFFSVIVNIRQMTDLYGF